MSRADVNHIKKHIFIKLQWDMFLSLKSAACTDPAVY